MVNKDHTLEHYRTQLADLVQDHAANLPEYRPLNISPWLAMSLMQKAIRRGREELALSAAATLLHISPERLWRRLPGQGIDCLAQRPGRVLAPLQRRHGLEQLDLHRGRRGGRILADLHQRRSRSVILVAHRHAHDDIESPTALPVFC